MPRRPTTGRASVSGVALVLALLLTQLAGAPARAAGGTLAGTLTGPDGSRFEYFRIDLYQASGPDAWQLALSRTITSWDTGLPVGDFAIAVPAGSYRACFTAMTFETAETVGTRCWSGGYEVFDGTDVVVAEGGTTTITPRLPREAEVSGRITGADGVGVSAYVAPYRRAPDGTWAWVPNAGAQSGQDGVFLLSDLDPGLYRFCLLDVPREYLPECWADRADLATATELAIGSGGRPSIYFRLQRRANISGTVTRPPASTGYLSVTAYWRQQDRWLPVTWATVAADGTYRITGLDAGTYRVCAAGYDVVQTCWRQGSRPDAASDITLATGQYHGNVNLAPSVAGFVTGALPDLYLGAEGYPNVTAWHRVDGTWEPYVTGDAHPTGVGNDWIYTIGSLPTGSYVVCVEHLEPEFVTAFPHTCNGGSPSPQGALPFEVVDGRTTTGIDLPTGRAGEIRGRVSGAPSPVRVDLFAPTGRLALSQLTTTDGLYRFRDLPAGAYRVGFHRAPSQTSLAAEWWRNRTDGLGLASATTVPVDGDLVTGISATLDPGGVITGRLLDGGSGGPVAGCAVQARARDGSLALRSAVTDASGEFAIGGLSTASYLVVVTQRCSGTPTAMFHDADSPTQTSARVWEADPVAVTRGLTSALPADLRTGVPVIAVTAPPTISGTPKVGRTLRASTGAWLPTARLTYAYRWYADGVRVADAAGRRLVLTADLAGARIRVRVVASARGWVSAIGRSGPVGPVAR